MTDSKQKPRPLNYFKAIMFFVTLGFVPLIVYYSVTPIGPELAEIIPDSSDSLDMFSYYKSWTFAICTIILGFNSLWDFFADNWGFEFKRMLKNPIVILYAAFIAAVFVLGIANNFSDGGLAPDNKLLPFVLMLLCYTAIFIPHVLVSASKEPFKTHITKSVAIAAVVFLMCVFTTSALTDFQHITYHGAIERYESVFALLGYIIIFSEVAEFASRKRESAVVLSALFFSATVIGVLGFFQLLGMDFFNTTLANKIVLGEAYNNGARLTTRFREAYATLYNPNCLGMYSAMMGPLALAAAIMWPKKSLIKYVLFVTSAFGIICLFGSNSSASLVGSFVAFASLALLVLANFVKNNRSMKSFVIIFASTAVVCVGALFVPAVNSKVSAMVNKFILLPKTDIETGYLRDLEIDGNIARLIKGPNKIEITNNSGAISINGPSGEQLTTQNLQPAEDDSGGTAYYSGIDGWNDFSLKTYLATLTYSEDKFTQHFGVNENDNLLPLTNKGMVADLSAQPRSIGFKDYQFFASSRGYIWSKTLPLVLEHPIIGAGVDSFSVVFPQNDVLGKTRFFANPYIIVDKPHNMYLQTAVNTGVVSLIAQMAMFVIFILGAFKRIVTINEINTTYYASLLGSTVGVIGYLVTGLSTDSTISVSPIFWAVLGLGYACIYAIDHNIE